MTTLSSASTLAEIQAAYDDNVDYDLDEDTAKAANFIRAARMLLRRTLLEVEGSSGARVRDSYEKIQAELAKAERWRNAHDSSVTTPVSGSVRFSEFKGFRD